MTTRWSPDTCECIVEYDDDINLTNVVKRCSVHQTLADNTTVFDTIKEENPRKNIGLDLILQNGPTGIFDIDAESGQRVFKKGIDVTWTWSGTAPDRVLTINIAGITLTSNQKNAIRNFLNNRFGTGKVILT